MKVLVTGAAGFIGFHLCKKLITENIEVIGLDNLNDYYDINLKLSRLNQLGVHIEKSDKKQKIISNTLKHFSFYYADIINKLKIAEIFENENIDCVCHLAAQAGVRYSLKYPEQYVESNIMGFLNVLECMVKFKVKNLIYASSSSVYGLNKEIPFNESQKVNSPISLYAVSKITNELMAHSYSHLYGINSIGLRFFTVYGPWGRPDMALFLFVKAATENKPLNIFNDGKMSRDFTYVDDVVSSIYSLLISKLSIPSSSDTILSEVFNVGKGQPIKLMDFVKQIEKKLDKKVKLNYQPIQPGDVKTTYSDNNKLIKEINFNPKVNVEEGIGSFIDWYINFYTQDDSKLKKI